MKEEGLTSAAFFFHSSSKAVSAAEQITELGSHSRKKSEARMYLSHSLKTKFRERNALFVLFAVITIVSGAAGQYVGDSCSADNRGSPGRCAVISNCPSVLEGLRRGRVPVSCGFQGSSPIVCCPAASGTGGNAATTPSTTTRQTTRATTPVTTVQTTTTVRAIVNNQGVGGRNNPKSIAERKCREYSQWVYTLEDSPVNLPGSVRANVSQCAVEETPLIVGGVRAKSAEFPHMAAIGYGSESNVAWLCGGSLISENFVLTAAHCTSSRSGEAKWVQVGDLELVSSITSGRAGTSGRILQVVERIRHPNYKVPAKYNDIALMRLAPLAGDDTPLVPPQPIPRGGRHPLFNRFIRPACLHRETALPFAKALATGWGRVGHGEDASPDLLKVQLSIISGDICNDTYRVEATTNKLALGVVPTQLCAGELAGGKDTCQGDSGGPLQYVSEEVFCMYTLIGVTSFGKICGFQNSPAVYSRVSAFLPWIVRNVWPEG
ncbi:serine protease snake-like [Ischnura elegans]|uniref:serine protease snake-like n=1 Tax=Ischnura elegans TaxID=197161 RepID=UPI001ED8B1AF|nr:serine protease snake-like [Ischnura elegans]